MTMKRRHAMGLLGGAASLAAMAQPPGTRSLPGWLEGPPPTRKVVIAWCDNRNANLPHTSVSHAAATIEHLGYASGLWDTFIRSDSEMITLQPPAVRGQLTLRDADAVFFFGHRNIPISDGQKADLLKFVKDDGKGFVAAHTALTGWSGEWREFTEMIGGYFDGHPWAVDAGRGHLVNEAPDFPATRHFPKEFIVDDEFYMVKGFDRKKARVLLRMDVSKLPAHHAYHGADNDFPVAWAKNYGKGRVFYSSFAHSLDGWDNASVQRMYLEALKWALGLSPEADATPRPLPDGLRGPATPPVTAPVQR